MIEKKIAPVPTKKPAASIATTTGVRDTSEALDDILAGIRGDGDESATLLGADGLALKIRGIISTQCPGLDHAIGRGGIPLGRLSILHGHEGCGKTTVALHLVAEVQRLGGIAIYMDKEYKLDPDYAADIGVDTKRLIISQPNHLEAAFSVQSGAIKRASIWRAKTKRRVPILVILDSMNAAITKAQFEGEWEDRHMAPQARCYSENLPKLIPQVSKEDVGLCWISQVRKKMNVQFGDDDEIAGGKSARFYASLIIGFKKIGTIKTGEEKVANRVLAECKKNQIAPPFRKTEMVIVYGKGIDAEVSLLDLAISAKVVTKSGAQLVYGGENIGNGLMKTAEKLKKSPELCAKIAVELGVPWKGIAE